jgi:hypothetical protein
MKYIARELGEMNIPLKPEARPVRKRPYRLNPVYKKKVKEKIDQMLEVGNIEPIEELEWISPMVVQEKKQGGVRIFVDLRKLNYDFLHDPLPTAFTDEVLENVVGQKAYSFTDGFPGYHQVKIASEDRYKTTFATEWGSYQCTVMPFGLQNAPTSFSRVVIASFKESIHHFLEVYMDDWTVYSLLKDRVEVLRLMLERCRQCQISLNIKKCIFGTQFGILLGHIVCKKGLSVDPAKIVVIVNFTTTKVSVLVKRNTRTYRLLQEIYKGLCANNYTNGKFVKGHHILVE